MKRLFLMLFACSLLLGCSKSEETDITKLSSFKEPYFSFEAPESKIIELYGENYKKEIKGFSKYDIIYDVPQNTAIVNYRFNIWGGKLNKTEVLFLGSEDNVDFLDNFLRQKYEFKSKTLHKILDVYTHIYESNNKTIKLEYPRETYTFLTLTYSEKY